VQTWRRFGCVMLVILVVTALVVFLTRLVIGAFILLVAGILGAVVFQWARGVWLRRRFRATWGRRGKRLFLVYSESPNWHQYITEHWMPRLIPYVVCVNWSRRNEWKRRPPLEVKILRYWGGEYDFNPMAVYFPKRGQVEVIRFRKAFKEFKRGKEQALRKAEHRLFEIVDVLEKAGE